jgi:hypothetical protein
MTKFPNFAKLLNLRRGREILLHSKCQVSYRTHRLNIFGLVLFDKLPNKFLAALNILRAGEA